MQEKSQVLQKVKLQSTLGEGFSEQAHSKRIPVEDPAQGFIQLPNFYDQGGKGSLTQNYIVRP